MEKHAVVRTDLLAGTDVRSELVTMRYQDSGGKEADIDNGNIVAILPANQKGKLDVAVATDIPSGLTTELPTIALVATPEVMYDDFKQNLTDFVNEAGKNQRGYILRSGAIFSVTAEAIDGISTVEESALDALYIKEGTTKLTVTAGGDSAGAVYKTPFAHILGVEYGNGLTYYVIKVA